MKKYSILPLLIFGLVFAPGASAQSDSSTPGPDDPKTTGIEHEDIGITSGDEPTSTAPEYDDSGRVIRQVGPSGEEIDYNETDFNFLSRIIETGAVYLKFDGVEGEAVFEGDPDRPIITGNIPNSSSGGNVETTWKVEEGEKAGGSGEMVIKGSKIKENSEVSAILTSGEGIPEASEVETLEDLAMYAAKVTYDNGGFNEIRMDDTSLVLKYNHGIRYLGFIDRVMEAEVVITFGDGKHGRVKVKFPWTHVFGRKIVKASDIISAYNATEMELDLENISKTHAQILDTLSRVAHDTAMAIVRKIG